MRLAVGIRCVLGKGVVGCAAAGLSRSPFVLTQFLFELNQIRANADDGFFVMVGVGGVGLPDQFCRPFKGCFNGLGF